MWLPTRIEVHSSSISACQEADALVIGSEWPEFAAVDLTALAAVMNGRVVMDARNLLDPISAELVRAFEYLDQDEFSPRTRQADHAYPAVLDGERNRK